MKKVIILLALALSFNEMSAQTTVNTQFKNRSFDERYSTLKTVSDAYEKAEKQVEEYIEKAFEAKSKENWEMERYYLRKALDKNREYNSKLMSLREAQDYTERIYYLNGLLNNK